jgi:FAD/FMN-containing dehydrogenase
VKSDGIRSWGNTFRYRHDLHTPYWNQELKKLPLDNGEAWLVHGLGRSYGDSNLNDNGQLVLGKCLDRVLQFDREKGLLLCEGGISLASILEFIVPAGWFLPVTPGTKFVTLAGAIANDVHGKNHFHQGTIGCHVTRLELLRSDGSIHQCSTDTNNELFRATIGGLGLSGIITHAEIQLIPVQNAFLEEESFQCENLEQHLKLFEESEQQYQYTVSWIDCLARGSQLGKGIFTRGNHCTDTSLPGEHIPRNSKSIPFTFPPGCLNKYSVGLFNQLYYRKLGGKQKATRMDYDPFFYPLDSLHHWNRLYGPGGFIQYQCVLVEDRLEAMKTLLELIARSGQPSPLNVLKEFGAVKSPGMLSFPRPGLTLALDFPFRGEKTLSLLKQLDEVVIQSGGALYPAKDSRMSAEIFRSGYPELEAFLKHKDPAFCSSFWRRVMTQNQE